MSVQEVVAIGVMLAGSVPSLVALWLRLRFQLRSERERRLYLLTAATALPVGSRIQERRSDGIWLTLVVGDDRQYERMQ